MNRLAVVLCLAGVFACGTECQTSSIQPIHIAAGTVLTFHLQNRLRSADGGSLNDLPEGTVLQVKMLDSIDSDVDRDGAAFRGSIASPITSRGEIVVHSEAGVQGLLALLRSRSHPEGFRYELLVTEITEGGKSYALTASLSPSLFETRTRVASSSNTAANENSVTSGAVSGKLP